MKPVLSPKIVFRVPKFSWNATLEESWDTLKIDISLASPSFYDLIKDVSSSEVNTLSEKERFTIWKYFNRAKFRATPFGTFGGFGIATGDYKSDDPIRLEGDFKQQRFVNWPRKEEVLKTAREILQGNPYLIANSTYYPTGLSSIRFVSINDKLFELAEVEADPLVLRILQLAEKRITKVDLLQTLTKSGIESNDLLALLEDMLSIQLLISENEPNIIGEDFFRRLGSSNIVDSTPYVICQAPVQDARINLTPFRHITALIDLLHKNTDVRPHQTLEIFKANFLKKFDQDEVPIMIALDPEMGVGYDELEQAGSSSEFAAQFKNKARGNKSLVLGDLKTRLSEVLANQQLLSQAIDIEKYLSANPITETSLPNSLSVILQLVDDQIFLEQIGGATANALCGRFTLGNPEMLDLSRDNAKLEARSNPGVLFFDVAYMGEANVDNINRRESIYEYQLSILNYDLSESPLTLNDILISVRGNEVMLRSKSLDKRLVPRIATAYNYSRSDLSLFRLLCDLQHQNIHSYILPDLEKWFPDQNYYPRLFYKNIVLSPRKWKLHKKDIPLKIDQLQALLEKKGLSEMFRCGVSDQLLCFDRRKADDLKAFLQYASKKESVWLEEFYIGNNASVLDKRGNPLNSQFIFNAIHENRIYKPFVNRNLSINGLQTVKANFSPGSEWLYFEIYCHQQRSDILLSGPIAEIVEEVRNKIKEWFFIRYDENGNHLRLRFRLLHNQYLQEIVQSVYRHFSALLDIGLVSDIQIKTYRREIARYGADLIDRVEAHFHTDSEFVLSAILSLDDDDKYQYAVALAKKILATNFEQAQVLELVKNISDSFCREHKLDSTDFKLLNKKYSEYVRFKQQQDVQIESNTLELSFCELLHQAGDRSANLFADLFHMHVNRIFHDLQRTHEMIIYYLLVKELHREKALKS